MPRARDTRMLAVLASFLLVFAAGCGDEEVVEIEKEPAIRVTVSASTDSVDTGGMVTVVAKATAENPGTFVYAWKSTGGTFVKTDTDSTTWVAPDDPNLYSISCVVTDGEDAGIGTDRVFVGDYVPADEPFYIGAATCAVCHAGGSGGDQHTAWSATNHAHAIEALEEIGMNHNAYCLNCHTVGSYGLFADASLDNGGHDETAVERLEGVQCENCHGPASNHTGGAEGRSVAVTITDTTCGQCHTDVHHPTWDEWQESAHASVVDHAWDSARCVKCHNGLYSYKYLDDPAAFTNPSADPTEFRPHTCAVCHDPHGNDNPRQLRDASVTDIALPNSPLIPSAGAGRLCMACHNGRRTDTDVQEQIDEGDDHFGPHHSVQGDMLAGVNAYEDVDPAFVFKSSKHILVEDACITCHVHGVEEALPYFTGHTFEPTANACQPCHGTISDFTEILAKDDFDGDGTVEGVQEEIEGLLDTLAVAIVEASATQASRDALENVLDDPEDFSEALGDTLITTVDQRKAGYNWAFVDYDGSKGVHNTTYSVQLLQRSVLFLDPGKLGKARLLVE
ncbi:MAG: multiheme c-type cytochrome [Candidatus Eisenbacteria bacterium]